MSRASLTAAEGSTVVYAEPSSSQRAGPKYFTSKSGEAYMRWRSSSEAEEIWACSGRAKAKAAAAQSARSRVKKRRRVLRIRRAGVAEEFRFITVSCVGVRAKSRSLAALGMTFR